MTRDEVLQEFRDAGAILEGHFVLSSGLHSPVFLQKALVFKDPRRTERLCRALADRIRAAGIAPDLIVSPAVGGLVPGYETARQLGIEAVWVEREGGEMRLRRFAMPDDARVVVVEDIVSTGLSIRESIAAVERLGARVLACACLIDRSAGEADVGRPLIALAQYKVPAYPADALPPDLAALPATKPGSRDIQGR